MTSDQLLTGPRIRDLVVCPTCGAKRGAECRPLSSARFAGIVREHSHEARRQVARALVRELRLGPVRAASADQPD